MDFLILFVFACTKPFIVSTNHEYALEEVGDDVWGLLPNLSVLIRGPICEAIDEEGISFLIREHLVFSSLLNHHSTVVIRYLEFFLFVGKCLCL